MKPPSFVGVSLRTRLTVWYGALLAVTLVGFSLLVYITLEYQLSGSVGDALHLRADQIQRVLGPDVGRLLQPEDVRPGSVEAGPLDEFAAPGIYVQVINSRGAVVFAPANLGGGELPLDPASLAAMQSGEETLVDVPVADTNVRVLTVPLARNGVVAGAIQVGQSLSPFETTMEALARQLSLTAAIALVTAMAAGWLFTRQALRPVSEMTRTARHIAATGDYRRRLVVPPAPRIGRGDELYSLTTTFNDMIARLEQLLDSHKRLLADTSHELRNPLTVIRGNLAVLRRGDVPEHVRREAGLEAEQEADRMGRLLDDLLLLARADAGDLPSMHQAPVDLADLVTEVVDRARPQAGSRSIHVERRARPTVMGDRDRLKQLIANIVNNAIRYTGEGGEIAVVLTAGGGGDPQRTRHVVRSGFSTPRHPMHPPASNPSQALVTVSDTGMGISAEQLPHLFERFYRADRARSRTRSGTGLGLAIAQYIAQAHGGSIGATSAGLGKGSTFWITLPLSPEVQPAASTFSAARCTEPAASMASAPARAQP